MIFSEMIKILKTLSRNKSNQTILLSDIDRDVEDIEEVSSLSSDVSSTTIVSCLVCSGVILGCGMRRLGEKAEIMLEWDLGSPRGRGASLCSVDSWD